MPVKVLKVAAFYGIKVVKNSSIQVLDPKISGCTLLDSAGNWQIVYRD